jgi:hypothetical protein
VSLGTPRWITAFVVAGFALIANDTFAQTGGFMDSATSSATRPAMTSAQISSFLPQRGRFTFPSPYGTEGVRVTNASDCGGQNCLHSVGYSYWRNMNNSAGSDTMLIFLGLERRAGGGGPTLFSYNKRTGEVQNRGPLFDSNSNYSYSAAEGWYFSATQPNMLYVSLQGQSAFQRYDVINRSLSTVFDVASRPDLFGSNRYPWQIHSSSDDRVHSATLKDGSSYADLGCLVYNESNRQFQYFPQKGINYDECQIDKSGRWLVIKEKTGQDSKSEVDNRIIDLQTGNERVLLDRNGAGGHSDTGSGYMVASDNMNAQPGAVRVWRFDMDVTGGQPTASVAGQGTLVYQTTDWNLDVGHVSHANSVAGLSPSQQFACGSNGSRTNLPRANEVSCFRLDGSLQLLIVAPTMTDMRAAGGYDGNDDYWKMPKGNLDPTGEYFIWTSNAGTGRMDAYIVRIPKAKLGAGTTPPPTTEPTPPTTPPTPPPTEPTPPTTPPTTPTPPPTSPGGSGSSVAWTNLVNVTASGGSLRKTAGCGGCPDAGAYSQQQVSDAGFMQLTMSETDTLRFIGLTSGGTGTEAGDIRYAFRLQSGRAEVRESGAYRTEIAVATGDTLRISVSGGTVQYSKNGAVFYTSSGAGSSMQVKASLYDIGATLSNVTIGSTTSATTSAAAASTAAATPATTGGETSGSAGAMATAAKRAAQKRGG